jgi:ABC-type enterochelin transport system permease subunit
MPFLKVHIVASNQNSVAIPTCVNVLIYVMLLVDIPTCINGPITPSFPLFFNLTCAQMPFLKVHIVASNQNSVAIPTCVNVLIYVMLLVDISTCINGPITSSFPLFLTYPAHRCLF